jgi:hypothetical protein
MSDLIVSIWGYLKITTRACAAAFPFRYKDLYILPGCRYAYIQNFKVKIGSDEFHNNYNKSE